MSVLSIAMVSCKEASALIEKKENGEIGLPDRLRLRLHLTMCKACQTYAKQSHLIAKLLRSGMSHNTITKETEEELKRKIISKVR